MKYGENVDEDGSRVEKWQQKQTDVQLIDLHVTNDV